MEGCEGDDLLPMVVKSTSWDESSKDSRKNRSENHMWFLHGIPISSMPWHQRTIEAKSLRSVIRPFNLQWLKTISWIYDCTREALIPFSECRSISQATHYYCLWCLKWQGYSQENSYIRSVMCISTQIISNRWNYSSAENRNRFRQSNSILTSKISMTSNSKI